MSVQWIEPTAVWDVRPWGGAMFRVADVNGDGKPEVLFLQSAGAHANEAFDPRYPELDYYKTGVEDQELFCLTLVDGSGDILWQTGTPWAEDRPFSWNGHWGRFCDLVDLDGDGKTEILLVHKDELRVYDATDGHLKNTRKLPNSGFNYTRAVRIDDSGQYHVFTKSGTSSREHSYGNPTLMLNHRLETVWTKQVEGAGHQGNFADVDGDGFDELLIGYSLFDHDGTPIWSHAPLSEDDHLDDSEIVDLDGDGEFEIAVAHDGHDAYIHNADGSIRRRISMHHCQNVLSGKFVDAVDGKQLLFVDRQVATGTRDAVLVDAQGNELSRHATLGYCEPVAWPSGVGPVSLIRVERPPAPDGVHRVLWVDPHGRELGRFRVRDSFEDHILRHGLDRGSYDRCTYHGAMHSPAVGDIDGDGHPELLVTDRESVWVFDVDPDRR